MKADLGVIGKLEVNRAGSCAGYNWNIEWKTGGDKNTLEVVKNSLSGQNVQIQVETLKDGGMVYGPLTGEFLQVAETNPQV